MVFTAIPKLSDLGFLLLDNSTGHNFTAAQGTRRVNISKKETQVTLSGAYIHGLDHL